MKFLCDKCKTRYSIGDDRVRGKILKIRCKNCANVITVREGMDIAQSEPRRNPTMAVQAVQVTESAPQGALGAAFASQLAKPPPALEEEWYVSMDGQQEGPFTLADAQRWVAGKPYEAELYCWSEGFDDWLPVDKVSHFRNLRKRPEPRRSPTMPPPIPKVAPRDEPKPLFAATMASIERSAGLADKTGAADSAARASLGVPSARGSNVPLGAKANGTGVGAALPSLRGTGSTPAQSLSPAAAALADAFKPEDSNDQKTTVDASPFEGAASTAPASEPAAATAPAAEPPATDDADDDNLEIGEVSRVVKLADIAAMSRPKPAAQASPTPRASAPNLAAFRPGASGSHQRLAPSDLGMNVDPALAALAPAGHPAPDESVVASSVAARHRRGMLLLITVSALMVLGVIVAVVLVVSGGQDELPLGLGGTRVIDTTRPEDIVRRQLPPSPTTETPTTTATTGSSTQKKTTTTTTRPTTTKPPEQPTDLTGPSSRLDPGEIEAMAAKNSEGTKRCYMRAQKGALGFEIADTKRIDVTLTVAKDGTVSDVQLSSHANNEFGQCLIARIKAWKFRESAGGTFRIALAFSAT